MVHVGALPGTPRSGEPVAGLAARAAAEAVILAEAGFDGLIVENMHDAPYVHAGPWTGSTRAGHGPEIVAGMTRCVLAVLEALDKARVSVRVGVQVLSGGAVEAIGIAHACGLSGRGAGGFVRCENFVFAHVADEGLLERAEAGGLLRYRKLIGAEGVEVWCDVKKKHASHAITRDVSLSEAVHGAEFFGADAVIVTGAATGAPTSATDVAAARGATRLPVLVGSGADPGSAKALFDAGADGLIVGSFIKKGGVWKNGVDAARCRAMVRARG
jgi:membrane complex biogenesis BtpA family protein